MENKMAVEKLKYMKPEPVFVVHQNVVELNAEETAAATKKQTKTYKCLDCGRVWTETIHAPLLMTHSEINHYYPQAKNCSIFK